MAVRVVLDACVLLPYQLSDTLLRLADARLFEPLWSTEIIDEVERNLIAKFDVPSARARRRVDAMRRAFPLAMVDGWEALVPSMTNDPKDRHVLAAATRGSADLIVTANLKDFPADALRPYDIEVVHPDDFLQDQFDLDPEATLQCLRDQRAEYTRPAMSFGEFHRALAVTVPTFSAMVESEEASRVSQAEDMPLPLEERSDEDALAAFFPDGAPSVFTPLGTAYLWWRALQNLEEFENAARNLSYNAADWNYQETAADLQGWAMMQFVDRCRDAPDDIAYVKFMPDTGRSMRAFAQMRLSQAKILTLVSCPDGRWLVWGISENYFPSANRVLRGIPD